MLLFTLFTDLNFVDPRALQQGSRKFVGSNFAAILRYYKNVYL